MRTISVMLSCVVVAFLCAPAAAESLDRVVAGLSYRLDDGPDPGIVQVVRVRHETGRVFVRHADGSAEWVDAKRLAARPQPVATDAGPYLFVAAALACLLDEDRCVPAARPTTTATGTATALTPEPKATPAPTATLRLTPTPALPPTPTTLEARSASQPPTGEGSEALASMRAIAEIPQPVR